jgi:hypothetical protein
VRATIGVDRLLVFHTGGHHERSRTWPSRSSTGSATPSTGSTSTPATSSSGATASGSRLALDPDRPRDRQRLPGRRELLAGIPLGDAIIPRYRERLMEGYDPRRRLGDARALLPADPRAPAASRSTCSSAASTSPTSSATRRSTPGAFQAGAGAAVPTGRRGTRPPGASSRECWRWPPTATWSNSSRGSSRRRQRRRPRRVDVRHFSLLTRDYGVGDEGIHRWRKLQLFYELWPIVEGGPDDRRRGRHRGPGSRLPLWDEVEWDEFDWAGPDDGEFSLLEGGPRPTPGSPGSSPRTSTSG